MRKSSTLVVLNCLLLIFSDLSFAQKKDLSFDQIFKGASSDLIKPLPTIAGWLDDEHYLIRQKNNTNGTISEMSVDVISGKSVLYIKPSETTNRTQVEPPYRNEKNKTASPDGKWIAFTRDNNLFIRQTEP